MKLAETVDANLRAHSRNGVSNHTQATKKSGLFIVGSILSSLLHEIGSVHKKVYCISRRKEVSPPTTPNFERTHLQPLLSSLLYEPIPFTHTRIPIIVYVRSQFPFVVREQKSHQSFLLGYMNIVPRSMSFRLWDSGCMGYAHIRYHGRSESDLESRTMLLQLNARVHHPIAFCNFDNIQDQLSKRDRGKTDLVIETTFAIQIFKELRVSLTAPKIHVCNLEITPD